MLVCEIFSVPQTRRQVSAYAPDTARIGLNCVGVSLRSATGNCELRTCPRSLRVQIVGIVLCYMDICIAPFAAGYSEALSA